MRRFLLIRIAGLDSGKQRDQTCLTSVQVHQDKKEFFVEGCKFWPLKTSYEVIETEIAKMHIKSQWSRIIVEVNAVGEHVYESMLRRYGLPVRPVTTVHKLSGDRVKKNPAQRLRRSMPKNEMVLFFLKMKKLHKIKFPINPDDNMKKLIKQLSVFSEKKTESGNITYSSPGLEHDDGVMSLLLALFEAKHLIEDDATHIIGTIPKRRSTIMEGISINDF